ncbi:MAG: AAA family ATPase [Flavobacteriaceae bacterium]|nr:AAA family ATPase [Flavobacteriaceae bacterium]
MELRKSNRSQAKIRIALQGASGTGKTYSSLLLAFGLCQNWNKIAVIDTENQSADLYSHLGEYNVLILKPPFTPERYIQAIDTCEKSGMEVIIIDSLSHEWEGEGGILDVHSKMQGNSFTNWSKLTPRHNALIQKILHSNAHVIATVRSKQDYIIAEKNGKQVPEKIGLKGVQRDGLEYDFSLVFEIDIHHNAYCTKDRTQLFQTSGPLKITKEVGEKIRGWCEQSSKLLESGSRIEETIKSIDNLEDLHKFYKECENGSEYLELFTKQAELIRKSQLINPFNFHRNGK